MRSLLVLFAGLLLTCGVSRAVSLLDYNVIVTNNASYTLGDITGNMAVGGNLTTGGPAVFNGSVTVGGKVSGSLTVNNGTLTYGSIAENISINPHNLTKSSGSFNVSPYTAVMQQWSTYYQGLTANSSLLPQTNYNNPTFAATPGGDNVAVFNVDGSVFSDSNYQNGWRFSDLTSDMTVVINVSGTDIKFTKGNFNSTGFASNIIWNFYEATTIDLSAMGGSFEGTILAPYATLIISDRQINGNVYVEDLQAYNTEIHYVGYSGSTPTGYSPPTAVPTVSAFWAALPILGAMGLWRYRRQHQQQA